MANTTKPSNRFRFLRLSSRNVEIGHTATLAMSPALCPSLSPLPISLCGCRRVNRVISWLFSPLQPRGCRSMKICEHCVLRQGSLYQDEVYLILPGTPTF